MGMWLRTDGPQSSKGQDVWGARNYQRDVDMRKDSSGKSELSPCSVGFRTSGGSDLNHGNKATADCEWDEAGGLKAEWRSEVVAVVDSIIRTKLPRSKAVVLSTWGCLQVREASSIAASSSLPRQQCQPERQSQIRPGSCGSWELSSLDFIYLDLCILNLLGGRGQQ